MGKEFMFAERKFFLADGEPWRFVGNHRAWKAFEDITGLGLWAALGTLGKTDQYVGPWYELAWALTATYRSQRSALSYDEFLELLPVGMDHWIKFCSMLSSLVAEAWPTDEEKKTATKPSPMRKKKTA